MASKSLTDLQRRGALVASSRHHAASSIFACPGRERLRWYTQPRRQTLQLVQRTSARLRKWSPTQVWLSQSCGMVYDLF